MLLERLKADGVRAARWDFPDRSTPVGAQINAYLRGQGAVDDAVVHLLFAANRFEKRSELLRLLASGTTLVLDRYSYSGVAYSAAKGVPHLGPEYCRGVEVGLPAADLVVQLAMSAEATAARGGYGQERYEKVEFQKKVAQQYEALRDERWLTLDARQPPEEVHRQVLAAVLPVVRSAAQGAPLGRLWDYAPLELSQAGQQQQQQSG